MAAWEAKLDPFSEAEVKPHDAAFDDAAWSKVELPQPFEKHIAPDFNGVVWYRLRVTLSAAQAEQARRIAVANGQIAIIQPAVDDGYAKPGHAQLLVDWQRYRYELTAVPELAGWPVEPQWPVEPDKVI